MVWYGMVWYGMVWYGMVWYGMVWYGMVWYGMKEYTGLKLTRWSPVTGSHLLLRVISCKEKLDVDSLKFALV